MVRQKKISLPQKTSDEVRDIILKFFYDRYKNSHGMKSHKLKISKAKPGLKQLGLTEQEIVRNLDYLVQTGWIKEEKETFQFGTGKRLIPTTTSIYSISDKGIDLFEGSSKFQRKHKMTEINITNIQGVTTVGDGNIVNVNFGDLYFKLNLLGDKMRLSDEFSDEEKLNYQAEIDTVKIQLSKPIPDKDIIKRAWEKLEKLATAGTLVQLALQVKDLIAPLIH